MSKSQVCIKRHREACSGVAIHAGMPYFSSKHAAMDCRGLRTRNDLLFAYGIALTDWSSCNYP
jgi:hypothetical protein